jgi:diguanylate cyclase (GGDEF)-like protein
MMEKREKSRGLLPENNTDLQAEEDERIRAMYDALPLACTFWDAEGNVVDCNQEALNLFKVSGKEEFCRRFSDFSPALQADGSLSREKIKENFWETYTRGDIKFPWTHVSAAGEWIPCYVNLVRIKYRDGSRVVGYTKDLRDIQELENKRRAADERSRELEIQTRAARVASEEKSKFLASMSHEIRTPMNAIIGMSDLIRTDNLDETQKSFFDDIRKMSKSLLQIINDILDISKIEAGKMELAPDHFYFSEVYDNICSLIRFSAEVKGLEFRPRLDPLVPQVIYGDDARIRQILTNLLNNAVKYTPEGTVEFTVQTDSRNGRDRLVFSVRDTGIGIKKEDFPKLFGNFQQLDRSANRGIVGTGLGLSITKNLVAMMDGEISFESEYGKGSVFTVALPLVKGDPEKVKRKTLELRVIAAEGVSALVADDNRINLKVALAFLRAHNIRADTAGNGLEAVEKVKAKPYDIVFMDHMMPEMDGVEAVRRIRALAEDGGGERFRTMPVIALSANVAAEARDAFSAAGANDFIAKPIDAADLNMKLSRWLPAEKIVRREEPRPGGDPAAGSGGEEGPLNRRAGLVNAGDDPVLYRRLCAGFYADHGGDGAKIRAALAAEDTELAHRLAHTLKGTAGLIGAEKLSRAALLVEEALRENRPGLHREVDLLVGELRGLMAELAKDDGAEEDPVSGAAEKEPPRKPDAENGDKYRILAVDDEKSNLMVLSGILSADYSIFTAKTGEEALSRAAEDPPDLILLDILLPGIDGFEVLRRLKASPDTRMIPVIIITGLQSDKDEERGLLLGAVDYIAKPFKNAIVIARVKTHIQIVHQFRMIERLGLIDPLTNIPNRRCFDDRMGIEWRRAVREGKRLSFLMMDVDKFKNYNDTWGHPQGDALLKAVSRIFAAAARRPGDLAARVGGEEFGVILPDADLKAAVKVAEDIRSRVERCRIPAADGKTETHTTISIGVASLIPAPGMLVSDFISTADRRLYAAKEGGRNRICSEDKSP